MSKVFSYNYIKDLEKKYKNSFSLSSTNNIFVFPPILKKIGLIYHVVYLVIEKPNENTTIAIKRPIGLISVNPLKISKVNTYDFKNYDFTIYANNLNKTYYSVDEFSNYLPNISRHNLEKLKISLELISESININFPFKIKKEKYIKYLENIKKLIPDTYFFFYNELIKNDINELSEKEKNSRQILVNNYNTNKLNINNQLNEKNKNNFVNKLRKEFFTFIKKEMVLALKNKGSYNKLLFFEYVGNEFNQILVNINNYKNCYLNDNYKTNKVNTNELIENLKIKSIKFYSQLTTINHEQIISIDILSKILIVFLNALLIEEIHKKISPIYEQEIAESKDIFTDEIKKIEECDEKDKLILIFNNLCKDYYEVDDNKFSNIFSAYLQTFKLRPDLSLIKIN